MAVSTPARDFFSGVSYIGRGFSLWRTAPRLMLFGLIPAVIVSVVYVVAIIALASNVEAIVAWATPFADSWDETLARGIRLLITLALVLLAVVVAVYTFTAITLVVGDPFYERIWRHVETQAGGLPNGPEVGFWRSIGRGIADALRLIPPALLSALAILLLGLIPLVGQVLAAVAGALVGGWFLTVELTGRSFEARGLALRDRRRAIGRNRALTVGFGTATYLIFLVPLGAVVMMPAAVAGAAMLSRRVANEPR